MNELTRTRRAFAGHWSRLQRLDLFVKISASMLGLTALISLLAIGRAEHRQASVAIGPIRGLPTVTQLASADGLAACLRSSGVLLGIVIVALTASVVAGDFERGVIRLWLVRQPSRTAHLSGVTAALAVFSSAAVLLVAAVTVPMSWALATWRGVDTAAWWSGAGWSTFAGAVAAAVAAAIAWVMVGAAIAVISRSVSLSITCITTLVIVESIAASAWAAADRWLPATTIANLAAGGSADQPFRRAAVVTVTVAVAALTVGYASIHRRDVTQ